ncbi:MAG: NAD-reducing hydrogenase HoxS subunit gamma [Phycisphaerae bacterium]|nr:NAD-reducing hydrogenase HoxS subunit gamma [Phycisphaerae bacterium]
MNDPIKLTIDGVEVEAQPGQTIIEAAGVSGIYIPRLCHYQGLKPHGSCRLCTVTVNGKPMASCTQPAGPGMIVETHTPHLQEFRRQILEMLLVEGNHFCMFCEKSGLCELQAQAYRHGITAPRYPYLFPQRSVDASHPDIWIDHNRCILCARCVRASRDLDGKNVFQFVGRGRHKQVAVNARARLADTTVNLTDRAIGICPVGALLKKRVGYQIPIGQRSYDHQSIGAEIEKSPCSASKK